MSGDLGVGGIRPVDDRPDRHPRNRNGGKKFTLDGEEEEKKKPPVRKKRPAPARKDEGDPGGRRPDGGIDILI